MILGKKYKGPEVDLWSLGIILFALLCGHLPFDDENIKDLYRKIANGIYSCPSYVSSKAKHLIKRLIQVDPRNRATLSEVLHHPWVNEGYSSIPSSYMASRPIIKDVSKLDGSIVAAMQSFGWKSETFERDWLACQNLLRPSPMRATYWLIKEMRDRRESESKKRKQSKNSHELNGNNNNISNERKVTTRDSSCLPPPPRSYSGDEIHRESVRNSNENARGSERQKAEIFQDVSPTTIETTSRHEINSRSSRNPDASNNVVISKGHFDIPTNLVQTTTFSRGNGESNGGSSSGNGVINGYSGDSGMYTR